MRQETGGSVPLLLWWSFDPGVIIGLLAVLNLRMSRAVGCIVGA